MFTLLGTLFEKSGNITMIFVLSLSRNGCFPFIAVTAFKAAPCSS